MAVNHLILIGLLLVSAAPGLAGDQAGPRIYGLSVAPGEGSLGRFEKLELTFQVETLAANLQMPYDPAPPPGVEPGIGITVDALFTPDNWQTTYRQPAFYYQDFTAAVKSGQEWIYPTGSYAWKVRFSPDQAGEWQFKLFAQDAGGAVVTAPRSFQVGPSASHGFVRVSPADPRYFEHDDGLYFPALGYNMNYDHLSWTNPVLGNEEDFQKMSANGIQLVRVWLSQWGIYGASWNPWNSIDPALHGQYIPATALTVEQAYPGSDVSMKLSAGANPCMFAGFMKPRAAIKANTPYRVRVRYKTLGLAGPRQPGKPFGLAAKTGGWLWGSGGSCADAGTGKVVTPYAGADSAGWQILEGSLTTGGDFLPYFYLALENVIAGSAYIDRVWVEEDLGDGRYGPNILPSPWMAHHLYMDQKASFAFDRLLGLADRYDVYLRLVLMEKEDWIFNRMDDQGQMIPNDPRCSDGDPQNDPGECPGNQWFYGSPVQATRARWLQQAWWRYVQARWGYSPKIHSWELLNEGDPASQRHYSQAEALGETMRQFAPDEHLVSTSFWHSFPRPFWVSAPALDFADIHSYVDEQAPEFEDTALSSYLLSMQIGARRPDGAGKPVIRGEIGFGPPTTQFEQDPQGLWLHNFIWAGINPGGLIESYWYENTHIYRQNSDGSYRFDHRPLYRAYYNFIRQVPLSNGFYEDAAAQASSPELVAWGQKDLQNGRAHLWIANRGHTWKTVAAGRAPAGISGSVALDGFRPKAEYTVEWWDPYQPDPARQVLAVSRVRAGAGGRITLPVDGLQADIAVHIFPPDAPLPPVSGPVTTARFVFLPLAVH